MLKYLYYSVIKTKNVSVSFASREVENKTELN